MDTHVDPARLSLGSPAQDPRASTVLLRVSPNARRIDAWALALTSKGVPSLLRQAEDGNIELHVAPWDALRAEAELDATDREEREAAVPSLLPRPVSRHGTLGAIALSVMLLAFFVVTGPRAAGSPWFEAGASDAERVLHGEWWRTVTALSLHADGAHVLSNVGFGTLVVGAVMRSEGVGWGSALVLAAGTTGNLINAWAHQALHSSVGFSTALFGAIGILGGLTFMHARRTKPKAWTALAGTLALLALLGTSEKGNVDMLAHVFGAAAGVGFGLLAARLRPERGQWLAGLGSAATVLGAWALALH